MPLSRRSFLVGGVSALVVGACTRDDRGATTTTTELESVEVPTPAPPAVPLTAAPFTLGLASGDPDSTSVVLWTRLLGADGDHDVAWKVLGDDDRVVAAGLATAVPADAHTVHALAEGLDPDTWYRYQFVTHAFESPVGRTRTAPDDGGDELHFAFGSCQRRNDGQYTAHANLAAEADLDLVVWLGDYVYEDRASTLDDYRALYATYKADPDLQAAHARAPWLVVWDDHEVVNNYTREVDPARRAAAYQAWWEHQPTRVERPDGAPMSIHRAVRWGSLASVFALDGRQHRDDQPCGRARDLGAGCAERDDAGRTMLGAEQEAWLTEELGASRSTWNVVAQQTMVSPSGVSFGPAEVFNLDQWDGYPAARERLLDVLADAANSVVLTGDVHASVVSEIRRGDDVVAVELVGTSMTSRFPAGFAELFEAAVDLGGAEMVDARSHGYVRCDVTPEALIAHYRVVETTQAPTSAITTRSTWAVDAGTPGVRRVD